jgi:hypothetical protein
MALATRVAWFGVAQLDDVPADPTVDVLVGLVEILPVEHQLVLLALALAVGHLDVPLS